MSGIREIRISRLRCALIRNVNHHTGIVREQEIKDENP